MDAKPKDGGPAFPVPISTPKSQGGMSLRAYIATAALQSMMVAGAAYYKEQQITFDHCVKTAVAYADALIAELNREP